MQRLIIHLDLDAFFCAVEELHNPDLIGKPFAVGGMPGYRGVVASASYPARQFGVRSAMPMSKAKRLCPDLEVVTWNHANYREYSKQVMAILHDLTPMVEQLSIDEAFMDVTGHQQDGVTLAQELQYRIAEKVLLPCSLGVATNKLIAKTANSMGKSQVKTGHYPNAITVVPAGEEASFLAPLPIRDLWGVGEKTEAKLHRLGLYTIGDIAQYDAKKLERSLGKLGGALYRHANGIDNRPIETEHEAKSISRETTFETDIRDRSLLDKTIRDLSAGVGRRLRKAGIAGVTIRIKYRYPDFSTYTRQTTLDDPTQDDDLIYEVSAKLLAANLPRHQAIRLIGVGVAGLQEPRRQLSLWDEPAHQEKQQLQDALDKLRDKYGDDAVQRGATPPPKPPDVL